MDLNKHIYHSDNKKPLHSNGYAEIANGSHFGATSNTTYEQRKRIDLNRQSVANYQRSTIGNPYGDIRTKPTSRAIDNKKIPQKQSLQQRNANLEISVPIRKFKEPASRPYNPYD